MPLLTVVEDYVIAAIRHAEFEQFANGMVGATVPGCPGIVAAGADIHECARDLYARLEEWIRVSLATGQDLPVIDGIDLNSESSKLLAGYHGGAASPAHGEFYADESEFEAALDRWDVEAADARAS